MKKKLVKIEKIDTKLTVPCHCGYCKSLSKDTQLYRIRFFGPEWFNPYILLCYDCMNDLCNQVTDQKNVFRDKKDKKLKEGNK